MWERDMSRTSVRDIYIECVCQGDIYIYIYIKHGSYIYIYIYIYEGYIREIGKEEGEIKWDWKFCLER